MGSIQQLQMQAQQQQVTSASLWTVWMQQTIMASEFSLTWGTGTMTMDDNGKQIQPCLRQQRTVQ